MHRVPLLLSLVCLLLLASQCAEREWNNPWDPDSPDYCPGPRPPKRLEGVGRDGYTRLRWMASQEEDVVGYRVYRSLMSGSSYALLNEQGLSESYMDITASNDTTYYYVVTAFDSMAPPRESGYSEEVEVTPLEEIELAYDDGSSEGTLCWENGQGGIFAVRFTPPGYPCRVVEVKYLIAQGWPDGEHQSFGAVIYAGSAQGPGTFLGSGTAGPAGGTVYVDLSWDKITVSEADFFVGNKQTTSYPECEGQCIDLTGVPAGRSWQFNGGTWSLLPPAQGNLIIRAIVQIGP